LLPFDLAVVKTPGCELLGGGVRGEVGRTLEVEGASAAIGNAVTVLILRADGLRQVGLEGAELGLLIGFSRLFLCLLDLQQILPRGC